MADILMHSAGCNKRNQQTTSDDEVTTDELHFRLCGQ